MYVQKFYNIDSGVNGIKPLGWKGLAGTNTLAYYKHSLIKDVKKVLKH